MPYTWLIRIPGLSALREPTGSRCSAARRAVLAGAAVQWVCDHAPPGRGGRGHRRDRRRRIPGGGLVGGHGPRMAAALPSVDGPVLADHSGSIVVDVPFGLRGGVASRRPAGPGVVVLATADGHPRAISYTSWVPRPTKAGIASYPFYRFLYDAQLGPSSARRPEPGAGQPQRPELNIG